MIWNVTLTIDIDADTQDEAACIVYDILKKDRVQLSFTVYDPEKEFRSKYVVVEDRDGETIVMASS